MTRAYPGRYGAWVGELIETPGGLALAVAMVLLAGFALHWVFGPQGVGLPAMIGVFALIGLGELVSQAGMGPAGIVVVFAGVCGVLLFIGMAMRLGADGSTSTEKQRSGKDR